MKPQGNVSIFLGFRTLKTKIIKEESKILLRDLVSKPQKATEGLLIKLGWNNTSI